MTSPYYNQLKTITLINESLSHVHAISRQYVTSAHRTPIRTKLSLARHPIDLVTSIQLQAALQEFKCELERIEDHKKPNEELFARLRKLEGCVARYSQAFAAGRELLIAAYYFLWSIKDESVGIYGKDLEIGRALFEIPKLTETLDQILHQNTDAIYELELLNDFAEKVRRMRLSKVQNSRGLKFDALLSDFDKAHDKLELLSLLGDL